MTNQTAMQWAMCVLYIHAYEYMCIDAKTYIYEFQNILGVKTLYLMEVVCNIFILCYTDIYGLGRRNSVF